MKFRTSDGKEQVDIFWSDHYPGCKKCREVNIERPATLVRACAMGSVLIKNYLVERQRPVVKEKEWEVRECAKKAGVFKDA